jgi:glutaredoxin
MRQPNVTVYGSHSCPDTNRAIRFLDAQEIPYELKSVDDFPEFNEYIAELNGGKRVMPTIQVNNHVLINPTDEQLGAAVAAAVAAEA